MKQRIISAIVLLAIFIPLLLIGKIPYAVLMIVLSWMGLYELLKLRGSKKKIPVFMRGLSYLIVTFFVALDCQSANLAFYMDYRIMAMIIFAYIMPLVFMNNSKIYNLNDALFLTGSTLFVGLSFNLLITIRNVSLDYIIYIFLIATITDTFALLTGRRIGKRKLAKDISPNKTIEGAIGGSLMGTFIASIYFMEVMNSSLNVFAIVVMSFVLTVIGQIGDLVFSSIKRYYNAKDFSNLIPGHGGVLDRLDSIIFITLGFLLFLSVL